MSVNEFPNAAQGRQPPRFLTSNWWVYRGTGRPIPDFELTEKLPDPPPWRNFLGGPLPADDALPGGDGEAERRLGAEFHLTEQDVDPHEVDMVNAALYLRRPLLVTGRPGTGKSSLAFRIARELSLGRVLRWPITSHVTLQQGLYGYDAIGRAQAAGTQRAAGTVTGGDSGSESGGDSGGDSGGVPVPPIGEFLRLGPLGTAFLPRRLPRVLLIDELDKSEADLPNDLLNIFEDGGYTINELERVRNRTAEVSVFTDDPGESAAIVGGRVLCRAFPMIVITSNGERDFPPAFLRRCLRLETRPQNADQLAKMAANHLRDEDGEYRDQLVREFIERSAAVGGLPADKLFDAIFLATSGGLRDDEAGFQRLREALWRQLTSLVP